MSRVTRAAAKALSVSPTENTDSPKVRTRRGTTPDVQNTPSKYTPAKRTRRADSSIDYVPSPMRRSRRLSTNSEEVSTPTKPRNVRSVRTLAEQPVPEEEELVPKPRGRGRPRRETESSKNHDDHMTPEKKRKEEQASKKEDDHTDKNDGKTETPARVTTRRASSRLSNSQTPTKVAKRTVVKLKRCSSHSESSDVEHEKQPPITEPVSTEKKKYLVGNESKKAQEKTPVKSAEDSKNATSGENEKQKQRSSDIDAKKSPRKLPSSSPAVKSKHATEANSDVTRVTTEELGKKDDRKSASKVEETDVKNTSKERARESLSGIEGAISNSTVSIKRETHSQQFNAAETIEIVDSDDSSQSNNENEGEEELESFIVADSEMDQSGRDSSGSESEEESRKNENETLSTPKEKCLKSSKTQDMSMSDDGNEPVTSPFPPSRRVYAVNVNSVENESKKEKSFRGGDISNGRIVFENTVMSISSEDVIIPETQQTVDMDVDVEHEANAETRLRNSPMCSESTNNQKDYEMKSNRESVSPPSPNRSTQLNRSSARMDVSQEANEDNNSESNKSVEDALNPETVLNTTSTSQMAVANQEAKESKIEINLNESTNAQTESRSDRRSLTVRGDSEIDLDDADKVEETQMEDKVSAIGERKLSCDDEVPVEKHDTEFGEKHDQSTERNAGDVSMDVQSDVVECENIKSTTVVENEKDKTSDRYSISSALNASSNKSMTVEEESDGIATGLSNHVTSLHNTNGCEKLKSPSNVQLEIPSGDNFADRTEVESQDLEANSSILPLITSNKSLPPPECGESSAKKKSFKNSEQNTEESVAKNKDASTKQHLELNKSQPVESCNTSMTATSPSSTSCIVNVSSSKKRPRMSLQSDWNKLNDSGDEDVYDQLVNSGRESAMRLQLSNANISGNTSGSELKLDKNSELSTSVSSVRSTRDKSENKETENRSMLLKNECADFPYNLRILDSSNSSESSDEYSSANEIQENKSAPGTPNRTLNVQKRSSIINSDSKRINTSSKNNVTGLLDVSKSRHANPTKGSSCESSSDSDESSNGVLKERSVVEYISEMIEKKLKEPKESSTRMVDDEVDSTTEAGSNIELETAEPRRSLTNRTDSKPNAESDSGNDSDDDEEVKNKTTSSETSSVESKSGSDSEVSEEETINTEPAENRLSNLPTKSPKKSPAMSPTIPPAMSPKKLPAKSPTKPPANSPTIPPTKSPTIPPAKTPTKLPAKSPTKPPAKSPTKPDQNDSNTTDRRFSSSSKKSPREMVERQDNQIEFSFSKLSQKSPRKSFEKQANATELSVSKSSEERSRKSSDNQRLVETVKLKPQETSEESETSSSDSDDAAQDEIEIKSNASAKIKSRQSREVNLRESINIVNKLNVSAVKSAVSHESSKASKEDDQTSKSDENKLNKSSNNGSQGKSSKLPNISVGHNSPVTAHMSDSGKYKKEILPSKISSDHSDESSTDSDESSPAEEENNFENEVNRTENEKNSPDSEESSAEREDDEEMEDDEEISTDSDASNSDSNVIETELNKPSVERLSVNRSKGSSFVSKNARQSLENIKRKKSQQTSSDESDTDAEPAQVIRKKSSTNNSLASESKFSPKCKEALTLVVDRKGSCSSNESSSDTEDDDEIDERQISRNLTNRSTPYASKTRNELAGDKDAKSLQIGSNSDDDSMEESDSSDEEADSHPKTSPKNSQKSLMQPGNRSDIADQMNNETSSNESESESSDESDESTHKESIPKSASKASTTAAAPLSQRLSSQKGNFKVIQSDLSCKTVSKMSTESGYGEMDDPKNKSESQANKLKRKESFDMRVSVQKDFGKVSSKLNDGKTSTPTKPAADRRESLLNKSAPQPIVSLEPKALAEQQQLSFSQAVKRKEQCDETDSIDSSSEGDAINGEANRANRSQANNASRMQRKSISFHDSLKLVGSKAVEKETKEDSSESDSSSDENIKRISAKTQKDISKNLSKSSCSLRKGSKMLQDRSSDETSGSSKQPIEKMKNKAKADRSNSLNISLKCPSAPTKSQTNKKKQNQSLKHTAALKPSQSSNTPQQLSETSSMHQESAGDTSNTNISTKSEMPFFKSLKQKDQSTPASNREKVKIKINDHTYISSDEKNADHGGNSKVVSNPGASKAQSTRPEDASRAGKVSIVEQLLKQAARDLLNKSKGVKRKRSDVQSSSDNSFENYAPMSKKEKIVLKKLKQKTLAQKDKKRGLFESDVLKEVLMDKINEAIKAGKIADAKKKKESVPNKPDSMVNRLKNAVTAFKAKETPETETEVLRAFFAFNRANRKPTNQDTNKALAPAGSVLSAFAAYNLPEKKIDKDKPSTSGTMPTKKRKQEDLLEEKPSVSASTSQKPHKKPQTDDMEPKSKKLKRKEHEGQVKKQIDAQPKKSHRKDSGKTLSSASTTTSSSSQNETVTSIASTSSIGSGSEWQVRDVREKVKDVKPKKVLKVLTEIPFGFKESSVTPKKVNNFGVSNATPKTIGWKVRSITDAGINVPEISKKERKLKRKRHCDGGESSPTQVWTSSGYFQVSDVIDPLKQRKYQLNAPGASTEFLVQPLNRGKLKSSGSSEYFSSSALEFKQKANFNKEVKRESSKEMLQKKVKARYF